MKTLFELGSETVPKDVLGSGTAVLQGFVANITSELMAELRRIEAVSPFRHMITPGGSRMSVALTNCGSLGWVTDRKGYRYSAIDPETQKPWPPMPEAFLDVARKAAIESGFPSFVPDGCLMNRYEPGARLTLHQDRDEKDFGQPIVSVSLGLPATFLFGGNERADKTIKIPVHSGDVLVWGGSARLRYHGINPLKEGEHPDTGRYRYNLTFRKAG